MTVRRLMFSHMSYVLVFSVMWNVSDIASKETSFSKQTGCKLDAKLRLLCAQLQDRKMKSLLECATECAKKDVCLGISMGENGHCYHHKNCSQSFECDQTDYMFTIYVKINQSQISNNSGDITTSTPSCQNNGIWNTTTYVCDCTGGWVGRLCGRLATTCKELSDHGYPQGWPDGLIWTMLKPDTYNQPIKVLCELRFTYFNMYIMRNDGSMSLTSYTLQDYIDGFYKKDTCFWLGLTKFKVLNDAGHSTIKLDTGFSSIDYNLLQMTYNDFVIGDESTGFNFTFSSSSRQQTGSESQKLVYGDCLTPLIGSKFSAPDKGYDKDGKNCAETTGTGWWFNNCQILCNPLGYNGKLNGNNWRTQKLIMNGTDCEDSAGCAVSMYFADY